jgi:hypothetical protein
MKKIFVFLFIVSLIGCKTEEDVGPATDKTFIRFLGTQDNNQA